MGTVDAVLDGCVWELILSVGSSHNSALVAGFVAAHRHSGDYAKDGHEKLCFVRGRTRNRLEAVHRGDLLFLAVRKFISRCDKKLRLTYTTS